MRVTRRELPAKTPPSDSRSDIYFEPLSEFWWGFFIIIIYFSPFSQHFWGGKYRSAKAKPRTLRRLGRNGNASFAFVNQIESFGDCLSQIR